MEKLPLNGKQQQTPSPRVMRWDQTRRRSVGGLFALHLWQTGDEVEVDFIGNNHNGPALFQRARLNGTLEQGKTCTLTVTDSSYDGMAHLIGRQINLSVRAVVPTPGGSYPFTFHSCMQELGEAAYVLPEEVDPEVNKGHPLDENYYWPLATYGRLSVAGEVLFEHGDVSMLPLHTDQDPLL